MVSPGLPAARFSESDVHSHFSSCASCPDSVPSLVPFSLSPSAAGALGWEESRKGEATGSNEMGFRSDSPKAGGKISA